MITTTPSFWDTSRVAMPDASPCLCNYSPAVPHAGHCCFGPKVGETRAQWDARWGRYEAGELPFCHPRPEPIEH